MRKHSLMVLALVGFVASALACNAPTPTPQDVPTTATADGPSTLAPQETAPPPTNAPPKATPTPPTRAATKTPSPTPTPTEHPTPTRPVSTGPLDFPVPAELDHWQHVENDEWEATILLHITGGAPPYTIHHDQSVTTTWETTPKIVFRARACGALVHTIIVESADGQSVKRDYWIPAPWCD